MEDQICFPEPAGQRKPEYIFCPTLELLSHVHIVLRGARDRERRAERGYYAKAKLLGVQGVRT